MQRALGSKQDMRELMQRFGIKACRVVLQTLPENNQSPVASGGSGASEASGTLQNAEPKANQIGNFLAEIVDKSR